MQGAVTPRPKDLCNGLAELAKEQHAKLLRICRHPMCTDSHQGALWVLNGPKTTLEILWQREPRQKEL